MKDIDRQPLSFYFGPWPETIDRWEKEGLPKGSRWDVDLGLDPGIRHVDVNLCIIFTYENRKIPQ
ncbi:MAG: hypothetical protein LBK83_03075 [Treponema sp.]|nr:hypothetical protein [Treponema sp.]